MIVFDIQSTTCYKRNIKELFWARVIILLTYFANYSLMYLLQQGNYERQSDLKIRYLPVVIWPANGMVKVIEMCPILSSFVLIKIFICIGSLPVSSSTNVPVSITFEGFPATLRRSGVIVGAEIPPASGISQIQLILKRAYLFSRSCGPQLET